MEITKVFIRRGWPNTLGNIVYVSEITSPVEHKINVVINV